MEKRIGQYVLITGSSTGIGRAAANHLAKTGFDVLAGVRKDADARAIEAEGGGNIRAIKIDVADRDSIAAAKERITGIVGASGLKGLVNSAGISKVGPVEFVPLDDWRTQFEVNFFGQIAVTQALLPLLRAHVAVAGMGAARIVLISSIAGLIGQPILGPYTASKHALESLGDSLRMELRAQGIHVSLIEPGAIQSEIWDKGKRQSEAIAHDDPARKVYGPMIDAVELAALQAAANAIPALVVARAIEKCLTSRTPKARQRIGRDAKVGALFHGIVPTRLFDWVLAKVLGLGRNSR